MKDERDNEHHTDQKKHKEIPKQTHTRGGTSADYTGRAARPSGMGRQTWQFTAVKNRGKIQELAAVIRKVLDRDGYDMYQPEVIIIPSNDRESPFGREDDACAMENMFLAAHSMGIGSVWINQLQGICDEPSVRQVLTSLGIPENHVVYGLAALGYADDVKAEKERIGKVVIVE